MRFDLFIILGPIQGDTIIDNIDFIPLNSIIEYEIEFIFEQSNITNRTEYIAFCQDIHVSIVRKYS